MFVCIVFQILIVGSYYSENAVAIESHQYGFSYSTSNIRFSTATEFIDKNQAAVISIFYHLFHIGQMTGICTQIVVYALLISHIYKKALEYSGMTVFTHRNRYSALEHILE